MTTSTSKTVCIEIAPGDLLFLRQRQYKLCFAKKVNETFNITWQSYDKYLEFNTFQWTPAYQLFGTNILEDGAIVTPITNRVHINPGEQSTLEANSVLEPPVPGGPAAAMTLINKYGSIHAGLSQLSIGINGEQRTTPIHVAADPIANGKVELTPTEIVLVWFEQNIATGAIFSTPRSNAVEIDLTPANSTTRLYSKGVWSAPHEYKLIRGWSWEGGGLEGCSSKPPPLFLQM